MVRAAQSTQQSTGIGTASQSTQQGKHEKAKTGTKVTQYKT